MATIFSWLRTHSTAATSTLLILLLGGMAAAVLASTPGSESAEVLPIATPTAPLPSAPTATALPPASAAMPGITPTPGPEERLSALGAPADADIALYDELLHSEAPPYDRLAAALALSGVDPADIPPAPAVPARNYAVGDVETFWLRDENEGTYRQVEARLVLISTHTYFWLDTRSQAVNAGGMRATAEDWQAAADSFDATYETLRAAFGSEPSPGIDGDTRLHVLNSDRLGSNVGGTFSGIDTLPRAVYPTSNEHEMFYMSIPGAGGIGSSYYNATLAHEFLHMIQYNLDPDEARWVNEGLAKLAQQVAGMAGSENVRDYLSNVDQSLYFFAGEPQDYGQSYLLMEYLYERFGPDFMAALIASPEDSFAGIDAALTAVGADTTIDALYGDFVSALYLDSRIPADSRLTFANVAVPRFQSAAVIERLPRSYTGEVNQYGLDVIRITGDALSGDSPVTITFTGARTAALVPADPASGHAMWWSQAGDVSFSTLTRPVDLRGVQAASLTYRAWWNLEPGWDYAYVLVSTDGGMTWTPQISTSSTDDNPNSQNYGHGLTGRSGWSGPVIGPAEWVAETVDLSAYAGREILLRFAVVTDESVTLPGLLVDDIAIPEIGFHDDAESDSGWTAEGFVRMHNRVPQRWLVIAVLTGPEGISVEPLTVINGVGTIEVAPGTLDEVALLIVGQTRFTLSTAPYRIDVTSGGA